MEVVDSVGVFLLSDRQRFVLPDALYCALAPLLDGRHTAAEIADRLAPQVGRAHALYALRVLERAGHIVEADPSAPPSRSAFWEELGFQPPLAEARLRGAAVSVAGLGNVPEASFRSALAATGVSVDDAGELRAVLTDDYLHDGLAVLNAAAFASGRPWLLAKPVGTVIWIGPVFVPGASPCWECLAHRLRTNRPVESYVQSRQGGDPPRPVNLGCIEASVQAGVQLAVTEAVKALARLTPAGPPMLTTFDLVDLSTRAHHLVPWPRCPKCGEGASGPPRYPAPLVLASQRKRSTTDGGYRTASPEQTLARYEHHVSPLVGIVASLERDPFDKDAVLHVYAASQTLPMVTDGLDSLRESLQRGSTGKGATDAQAKASGLCEALERYSGQLWGDEIVELATYRHFGERALHPNACMLFSEAQYRSPKGWEPFGPHTRVPEPFDEKAEIAWTPLWSLTHRTFKYLPTAFCYFNRSSLAPAGSKYCSADTNGNAAGNTLEEAILQGFLELVERDSMALWWYNRIRRPMVDLDSFDDPSINDLRDQYDLLGREVWVLDLTTDLPIPVFVAVSRRTDGMQEGVAFGFGAHLDPRIGVLRALTELNQRLSGFSSDAVARTRSQPVHEWSVRKWTETATVSGQPYLSPDGAAGRRRGDYRTITAGDLRDDIVYCQELVEARGMEMLVLDQTRQDAGIPVVKVVVPGLRHFRPRLAPGRLYDVPCDLGWVSERRPEEELNPTPLPLP